MTELTTIFNQGRPAFPESERDKLFEGWYKIDPSKFHKYFYKPLDGNAQPVRQTTYGND